jgi:hypothetical protein
MSFEGAPYQNQEFRGKLNNNNNGYEVNVTYDGETKTYFYGNNNYSPRMLFSGTILDDYEIYSVVNGKKKIRGGKYKKTNKKRNNKKRTYRKKK